MGLVDGDIELFQGQGKLAGVQVQQETARERNPRRNAKEE
jgi:hypothetical protein